MGKTFSKRFNIQRLLAPAALVILYIFFSLPFISKTFFSIDTMVSILDRTYYVGFLAFGVTFVIISGGTGNPYFTTDTASALRGIEIEAEIMLKGTRVDGIYTADPEKFPDAVKFDKISFDEIYNRNLKIIDLTAITLCKENNLPLLVFNMDKKGNLLKAVDGENIGTIVHK